jgi:hypothetical protein
MGFKISQASSVFPILWVAFRISKMSHVPAVYKRSCMLNAIVAFLYHGFQKPYTHKNGIEYGSYSNDPSNRLGVRTLRRIDLSIVCFLPCFVALHKKKSITTSDIILLSAVSSMHQWTTSCFVSIMLVLSTAQYMQFPIYKRMLAASIIGGIAFGNTPPNRWTPLPRYIWHSSVAAWIYGSAYMLQ